MATVLRMNDITKQFPGVLANDGACFEVEQGEVHALLGENGAGKTTLMNILYGLYQPTSGEILLRGSRVVIDSPRTAIAQGVGMVHQHFMLIPALTVVENIVLGMPRGTAAPGRRAGVAGGAFLNLKAAAMRVRELSDQYHFRIDPEARIRDLSVGEQQRIEIIKALYRGADILILDEPTAVLTPQETGELFEVIRRLTDEGHTVIFISHKLNEVMAICDRITVLRQGHTVGTVRKDDTAKEDLARMMVGRDVLSELPRRPAPAGGVVLRLDRLEAMADVGVKALKGMSLDVNGGEILGIAGVDGNGQHELVEVITGLRPACGGSVFLKDTSVTNWPPRRITEMGVAHIPADRHARGLVLSMTLTENLALQTYYRQPLCRGHFVDWAYARQDARRLIDEFDVRTPHEELPAKNLSGGNQQKVVLARELSRDIDLLIAAHPTRGLDVGATEYVHRKIMEQRDAGAAVLLISTDLDEILALSDRIAVIYEGRIVSVVSNDRVDINALGLMMAGTRP
ncbi:MAG: ABC transporter ATP-binding protein [Firmicutes bacterium]|nr:ABC transporter ATP-binding protein [Bacillota bacterium]